MAVPRWVTLNTKAMIPLIGIGTFRIKGQELVYKTLEAAIETGYRSVDTAGGYGNEVDIGNALEQLIPKHNLKREDLFLTSKLAPNSHGYEKCRAACLKSLHDLRITQLDLYLIHWPGVQGLKHDDVKNSQLRLESWRCMESMVEQGYIKSIGVSNYTIPHLEELLSVCQIQPSVLQVECHPHLVQSELKQYCDNHGIHFQAYSSLGTTTTDNKLLHDPVVVVLAKSYKTSPAQILLKWAIQRGIGVLPKSTSTEHIAANIDIFDLKLADADLRKLDGQNSNTHYCWNPETIR